MKKRTPFLLLLPILWLALLLILFVFQKVQILSDGLSMDINKMYGDPGQGHWFGFDSMGRDMFLRVISGFGVSLTISMGAMVIVVLMALFYGGVAGWKGGLIDRLSMSFLEIWSSVPSFVLYVTLAMVLENRSQSLWAVISVLALTGWARMTRFVRGEVQWLRHQGYMTSSVAMGANFYFILRTHILPYLGSRLIFLSLFQLPSFILAESFLSFIGLGVQPPATSLGVLLHEGWKSMQAYPHLVMAPAFILFSLVWSLNALSSFSVSIHRKIQTQD